MVLGGDVLIVHNKSILAFQCSSLWVLFAVTRILSGMEIISTLLMTPFISQNLESLGSDLELINSALSVIISPLIDGSPGITDLVLYWVSFLWALLSSYISSFSISGLWLTHHQCTKFLQETLPDVGVCWYCISATCKINIWVCFFLSVFATGLEEIRNDFGAYRKALGFGLRHELGI